MPAERGWCSAMVEGSSPLPQGTRTSGRHLAAAATPGCVSLRALRCGAVKRYFGDKDIDLGRLADHCGVHRNTASKQNGLILAWLRGKPGRDGKVAEPGVEAEAMQAITAAMEGVELLAK